MILDSRFEVGDSKFAAVRPAAIARELWCRHVEPEAGVSFEERLAHHLGSQDGFVVSSPVLFAMGLIVQLGKGERGWFVEISYGKLGDLFKCMPFELPYIVFQRNPRGDTRFRVLPVKELKKRGLL